MNMQDAASGAVQGMAERWAQGASIGDVARLMGGNRALAQELGVSVRTVQRWQTAASERRQPSRANRAQIGEIARSRAGQAVSRELGQRGATIIFSGQVIDPSGNERERSREQQIEPDALRPFLAAYAFGDTGQMGGALEQAFLGAWGMPGGFGVGDIQSFELVVPHG